MQQCIISRVIENLVERLAIPVPHLQIVIFRIVFFYLNQQNSEKNEKFETLASFNEKSDF